MTERCLYLLRAIGFTLICICKKKRFLLPDNRNHPNFKAFEQISKKFRFPAHADADAKVSKFFGFEILTSLRKLIFQVILLFLC